MVKIGDYWREFGDTKNIIIAVLLVLVLLFAYHLFSSGDQSNAITDLRQQLGQIAEYNHDAQKRLDTIEQRLIESEQRINSVSERLANSQATITTVTERNNADQAGLDEATRIIRECKSIVTEAKQGNSQTEN